MFHKKVMFMKQKTTLSTKSTMKSDIFRYRQTEMLLLICQLDNNDILLDIAKMIITE